MRSSNKVFIERISLFLAHWFLRQQQIYMIEWLRDNVTWLRSTAMGYFLSRKKQESVVFVKEEFLHKKIQKKRKCFRMFLIKNSLTLSYESRWCETVCSMEASEGYKVIESLIKFTHNILRECLLDFCQIFCNLNQFSKTCS